MRVILRYRVRSSDAGFPRWEVPTLAEAESLACSCQYAEIDAYHADTQRKVEFYSCVAIACDGSIVRRM